MELDELKQLWQEHDLKLDEALRINREAARRELLRPAGTALRRMQWRVGAGIATDGVLLLWLGRFLGDHFREPRFLLPAALLHLAAIAGLGSGLRQWIALRGIDLGEPVLSIQRRLEALRVMRLRLLLGIVALSPLLWLPMLVVALRGFLGVDAYARFSGAWMLANLLFGLVFVAVAVWAARRYADRAKGSPRLQRLMWDLSGTSLSKAIETLRRLESFERGEDR